MVKFEWITLQLIDCNQISDGTGYVEDGREIFDEEVEEETTSKEKSKKESKKRLRDVNKTVSGNASIQGLFSNVVSKKKEKAVKVDDDDILADILGEINPNTKKEESKASTSTVGTASVKAADRATERSEMARVKEYMQNFSKNIQKKTEVKALNTSDDVSNHLRSMIDFF